MSSGNDPYTNSLNREFSYEEICPQCEGNMICVPYGETYHCTCKECSFEMTVA